MVANLFVRRRHHSFYFYKEGGLVSSGARSLENLISNYLLQLSFKNPGRDAFKVAFWGGEGKSSTGEAE